MFSGRERDEIKLMAVVVALYYAPYMLKAKDTASAPALALSQLSQLNDLREVASIIFIMHLKMLNYFFWQGSPGDSRKSFVSDGAAS